jgi:uncharacterized protein YjaG (DUF416 family)
MVKDIYFTINVPNTLTIFLYLSKQLCYPKMIEEIKHLEKLDFTKQLSFAYLTCERLLPNYIYFSLHFKFGNPQILKDAIIFIHQSLINNSYQKETIITHLNAIDKNTPYPEKFDTILASSALDSCSVVSESLNFLMDKKIDRIKDISTLAIDTIDMYIQERDNLDFNTDKQFEEKIQQDPLMQREIYIQKGIISFLNKIDIINEADIDTLVQMQVLNSSLDL